MIERNEKGKLCFHSLDIEIFFDDLLDICESRIEVESVVNNLAEHLLLCAQDKLKDLGDEDPYDITIDL